MNRDQFWLTYEQFSKIEPHLPTNTRELLPVAWTVSRVI